MGAYSDLDAAKTVYDAAITSAKKYYKAVAGVTADLAAVPAVTAVTAIDNEITFSDAGDASVKVAFTSIAADVTTDASLKLSLKAARLAYVKAIGVYDKYLESIRPTTGYGEVVAENQTIIDTTALVLGVAGVILGVINFVQALEAKKITV